MTKRKQRLIDYLDIMHSNNIAINRTTYILFCIYYWFKGVSVVVKMIATAILFVTSIQGADLTTHEYYSQLTDKLSIEQLRTIERSYHAGSSYDLGYTLAAIAWKESSLGRFKMNLTDGFSKHKGSFGLYHSLLSTVMSREHLTTNWSASRIAERLVSDDSYAAKQAIIELQFWKHYWDVKGVERVYSHMVGSYNAGRRSIENTAGSNYAIDIRNRIKAIKLYYSTPLI